MQSLQHTTTRASAAHAGNDRQGLGDAGELAEQVTELIRVVQFRDRDRVCCHGLTVSECHALKVLDDVGGLTINELAGELYLDKSTTSRLARGMEEKRLVKRVRDAADARQVRVEMAPRGRTLVRRVMVELADEYEGILADVSPEGRETLTRVLKRITSSLAERIEVQGGRCCVVDAGDPAE